MSQPVMKFFFTLGLSPEHVWGWTFASLKLGLMFYKLIVFFLTTFCTCWVKLGETI